MSFTEKPVLVLGGGRSGGMVYAGTPVRAASILLILIIRACRVGTSRSPGGTFNPTPAPLTYPRVKCPRPRWTFAFFGLSSVLEFLDCVWIDTTPPWLQRWHMTLPCRASRGRPYPEVSSPRLAGYCPRSALGAIEPGSFGRRLMGSLTAGSS